MNAVRRTPPPVPLTPTEVLGSSVLPGDDQGTVVPATGPASRGDGTPVLPC